MKDRHHQILPVGRFAYHHASDLLSLREIEDRKTVHPSHRYDGLQALYIHRARHKLFQHLSLQELECLSRMRPDELPAEQVLPVLYRECISFAYATDSARTSSLPPSLGSQF